MSDHVNRDQIRDWLENRLEPATLAAVSGHLDACPDCRALAAECQPERVGSARAAMGSLSAPPGPADHPDQEELCRYADGELDSVDGEIVEGHLEACQACARELAEIRSFRAILTTYDLSTVSAPSPARSTGLLAWLRRPVVWAPLQSAAAAVLVGVVLWNGLGGRLREAQQAAGRADAERLALRSRLEGQAVELAESRAREDQERELAALYRRERDEARRRLARAGQESVIRNGEVELVRRPDGRWERRAPVDAAFQVALGGPLQLPDDLPPRVTGRGVLRGGDEAGVEVAAPNGVIATTLRPEFSWKPVEGAAGYRLGLYREDYTPVEEAGAIQAARWSPQRELLPATVYRWQVTALKADGSELASSAEIQFRTASAKTLAAIRRMEADPDATDAERALVYARAGAPDRARDLLRRVAAENPGQPDVRRWMDSVEKALKR